MILLCYLPASAQEQQQEQERKIVIKQVQINGNQKIGTQTLLSKMRIKEGNIFSQDAIRTEIENLYGLGHFNQIEVFTNPFEGGLSLLFLLHEKPGISHIAFEGNHHLRTETLKEKLSVKNHTLDDAMAVAYDIKTLQALYEKEGFRDVTILPVRNRISDSEIALTFSIKENDPVYVEKIKLNGVLSFPEEKIKKKLATKEYFWLPPWVGESERIASEKLVSDREKIKDFYLNEGYLQVQVSAPEITMNADKESAVITFTISEGDPYKLSTIRIEGNAVVDRDTLTAVIEAREGQPFSKEKVGRDIRKMTDLYGERGYLFANVIPDVSPNAENKTVALTYKVIEGDSYHVRNIHIRGNDKTRDKIIRREIRQNEQEIVNTQLLRRSFQRINNLNFFEDIQLVPQRILPGLIDLNVEVREKSTGTLSLGGGYSSVDNFVGQFEVNQGNLFGRGHLLRAKAEFGGTRSSYSLTFREPYLFDTTYSGQIDLFNNSRTLESYKEKRTGGNLILGKSFGEHLHSSISYTLETLKVFDLNAVAPFAPSLVQAQAALGETLTSALGFSISRDTRDFRFDPKEGTYNAFSLEYAGTFLGGDNAYYKAIVDSSRYFPAWRDHVFSLHGRAGFADGIDDKELPAGERFFVGGINTVRGFKFGKAGPLTSDGLINGGNKELFLNAEYLMPLAKEAGLKWLIFYDIGAAYDDAESIAFSEFREGAGVGIRWISPIGPLRLEWGRNLNPKPGESDREFEFSIGTMF